MNRNELAWVCDGMDKKMLYCDLVDSAMYDKHFNKTITPFSDAACDDYLKILRELEMEGKIALEECKVNESIWDKVIRVKGYII
jgi:hypothetical protein